MPALKHKQKLNSNLWLGVQIGQFVDGRGYKDSRGNVTKRGRGVWTCEIKFAGEKPIYRTTKVKYEEDSQFSKDEAIRRAYEIFAGFSDRYGRGLDVSSANYVTNLLDKFITEAEENTEENEALVRKGLQPRHIMWGGRNPWRRVSFDHCERQIRLYVHPFAREKLPTIGREANARIENVKKRDWDQLDGWLLKNNPLLSIESRLKVITECRKFLHWCYKRQYIEEVPSIQRPHRGGTTGARQRMRKEITADTYKRIVDYTREMYTNPDRSEFHRDQSYLFHLWILIMANTGIRCPGGATDHTLIRWEDVTLPEDDKETATLFRPWEKTGSYEAIIMPRGVRYIKLLKEFYKQRKIPYTKGYMFKHPHNTYYGPSNRGKAGEIKIRKGDPIKSFRTQWNNMAKALDLHEFGTKDNPVPQSERISPTSLRAWFITQRLYSDKQVKIELLARVTGTSVGQIEARYLRLDMDKNYEHLTAGAYDDGGGEMLFEDGYYVGTAGSEQDTGIVMVGFDDGVPIEQEADVNSALEELEQLAAKYGITASELLEKKQQRG